MSRRPNVLALLITAGAFAALAFAIWPHLDLTVSSDFYSGAGFPASRDRLWRAVRAIAYWAPNVIIVILLALYALRKLGLAVKSPSNRSVLFLVTTLAIGPGLLINVVLKDHSHRPRPTQVSEFGGADAFRPWYRFDGACRKNCSFASGEVSSAFWTIAPALLTPPEVRIAAVSASLLFGTGVAGLRLAFGGHFLSDVVLSAFLTLILVLGFARWLKIGGLHGAQDRASEPCARGAASYKSQS